MDPVVTSSPRLSPSKTPNTSTRSSSPKLSWRAPTKAAISTPTPTVADALASPAAAVVTSRSVRQPSSQSGAVLPPSFGQPWSSATSLVSNLTPQTQQQPGSLQSPSHGPDSSNCSTPSITTRDVQNYYSQLSSSSSASPAPYNNVVTKGVADLLTASTSSSPFGQQSPLTPHTPWSSSSLPFHLNPALPAGGGVGGVTGKGTGSPMSQPSHPYEGTTPDLSSHAIAQLAASLHYSPQASSNSPGVAIPHPFAQGALTGGQQSLTNSSSYLYYNHLHNLPPSGT